MKKVEEGDRRKYLLKQIDIAEKDLLELQQEYQEDLREYDLGISEHPKSNSIKLQEWRIEKLYNQLRQLDE